MTVIEKVRWGNLYWHEAFEENVIGPNAAKVFALLYLVMGEDYTYNMAKQFKNTSIAFKALKDPNQIQPILKSLEENKFIVSRKDLVDGRERKYYSLNPQILHNPDGSDSYQLPNGGGHLDISEEDINDFLKDMDKKDRKRYLDQWNSARGINKFDYITFLLTIQEEANVLGKSVLVRGFDAYIREIQRLERESRRVRTLTLAVDAIIRCNDPMKCPDSNCKICNNAGIRTRWDDDGEPPFPTYV
jgi:DNA-binding MarR family transcriptional regulator